MPETLETKFDVSSEILRLNSGGYKRRIVEACLSVISVSERFYFVV